jgi:hypothetical protein
MVRSRRNFLDEIDASTLRLLRSCVRRVGGRSPCWLVRWAPGRDTKPVRATPRDGVVIGVSECPLTVERHHSWRAAVKGPFSFWACHNDREDDRFGSPRESRDTVPPGFWAVKAAPERLAARRRSDRIAQPFQSGKPRSR